MSIKALIPVRSGSQRVKNKNIRPFAGSSLLEIKIKQMLRIKEAGFIDEVVVNSNSDEMLEISRNLGAEIVKREEKFASNVTLANDLYENLALNTNADILMVAHVTSPLISDDTIKHCLNQFTQNTHQFDSLASVSSIKHFLWLNGKALNYDPNNKPRSQDLPNIIALNHAINILPKEIMQHKKDLLGYKPNFYLMNDLESVDIDNEVDFEFAEFLYKKYSLTNNKIWGGGD